MGTAIILVVAVILIISALLLNELYKNIRFRRNLKVYDTVMVRYHNGDAFGGTVYAIKDTAVTVCDVHLKMHLVSIYDIYEA